LSRTALITGITGQDGSYLAELLLSKGYAVHGIVRRTSTDNQGRLTRARHEALVSGSEIHLHAGDMADASRLRSLIEAIGPAEIYHLAAQTDVGFSFDIPEVTTDINALGTLRMLEAARLAAPDARFYNASSSEIFGRSAGPQSEDTPFSPCSPYGYSKEYAYWAGVNYRNAYDLHVSNGILFNHESERRGANFVTQKVARFVAKVKGMPGAKLGLGNLGAIRDWGYAPEYVEAMWLMLQRPEPGDYVIATGVGYSVAQFCELAFKAVGLEWQDHVVSDPEYFRPEEPAALIGDSSKAARDLGWGARTGLPDLVTHMVEAATRSAEEDAQGSGGRSA
jgi:GDPmannose 4,6-dehydratase